jgi:hypothetical protein
VKKMGKNGENSGCFIKSTFSERTTLAARRAFATLQRPVRRRKHGIFHGHQIARRRSLQQRTICALVAAKPDVFDAQRVEQGIAMGVVGETGLFVFLVLAVQRPLGVQLAARTSARRYRHPRSCQPRGLLFHEYSFRFIGVIPEKAGIQYL